MTVTNNGHTGNKVAYTKTSISSVVNIGFDCVAFAVLFSLPSSIPAESIPYVTGGGLSNRYNFVQFHFHWGNDSAHGSEHRIKSKW